MYFTQLKYKHIKMESLAKQINSYINSQSMSKSSEMFMATRIAEMQPDEYFQWLTSQEALEEMLVGDKPTLTDLDNLFTCADDE
jgi:hypothetical protein